VLHRGCWSAISRWEVAMLVNSGRLALSLDVERWLALLASHPAVRLLGLDLADRFLVAQGRELGIPPLRADNKISSFSHVRSLW
jgi:PIN domain nuclease of toxin-antitoxin system